MLHVCSISPSNQSDLQVTREQLTATDAEKHIIQTELDRVKVCSYYAYVKVSHECACVRPCVCGCIDTSIDCVRACVRACVHACVCACVCVYVVVLRQILVSAIA